MLDLSKHRKSQLSQNPRAEILNAAALHSSMHAINLVTWGEARMEEDSQKAEALIKRKHQITKQAQELYRKNDTEGLKKLLNQLNQEQNERGPEIIARADQALLKARNKDKIANQLFLILYIIGSVCVGLGFLLAKRDMVKSV